MRNNIIQTSEVSADTPDRESVHIESNTLSHSDISTFSDTTSATDTGRPSFRRTLRRQSVPNFRESSQWIQDKIAQSLLKDAYEAIIDANDNELAQEERSNCYDEWQNTLQCIAEKSDLITTKHRRILGTLIVASVNTDISDIDKNTIKIFINATNVLRTPKLTSKDTRDTIRKIVNMKKHMTLAIDPDLLSKAQEEKLTEYINSIIEHDKK